ncbi:MAG: hypothetical protein ACJAQ8_000619 [Haliea salexigens]|jgi:hypothetical protein
MAAEKSPLWNSIRIGPFPKALVRNLHQMSGGLPQAIYY